MALAYDANRVTRDVDATFVPHGVVLEEARNVAQALGLPPWWLNEQASAYVSTQHDEGKREVFDHPGIRVMAASSEHVFAMKAFAARGPRRPGACVQCPDGLRGHAYQPPRSGILFCRPIRRVVLPPSN
jgi:hypothetical protein